MAAHSARCPFGRALALCWLVSVTPAAAEDRDGSLAEQVERLKQQNAELSRAVRELRTEVGEARDEARAARDAASAAPPATAGSAPYGAAAPGAGAAGSAGGGEPLAQTSLGGARLQLLDISLDTLFARRALDGRRRRARAASRAAATTRAGAASICRRRSSRSRARWTRTSRREAHLVYFLDPEGESQFELEEAFVRRSQLPFGLHEKRLPARARPVLHRVRPDEPAATRTRGTGRTSRSCSRASSARTACAGRARGSAGCCPLPWFSEVHARRAERAGRDDGELPRERRGLRGAPDRRATVRERRTSRAPATSSTCCAG